LFLQEGLPAPWSLRPATTHPEQATAWLADYTAVGIEGPVFRPLASTYVPGGRGWTKVQVAAHRGGDRGCGHRQPAGTHHRIVALSFPLLITPAALFRVA
jgi:hypothetical protein